MAFNIKLTYKGTKDVETPLVPVEVLLGDDFRYERDDTTITLFNPRQIARGISVTLEDESVTLSLKMPTSATEVKSFFALIDRVASHISPDFELVADGSEMTLDECLATENEMLEFNRKSLRYVCDNVSATESVSRIDCVYLDLSLGQNEASLFCPDDDCTEVDLFAGFMHDRQRIDATYTEANYYIDHSAEGGVFGAVLVPEATNLIFPNSEAPLRALLGDGADKVTHYKVALFSQTEDKILGDLPLATFLELVPPARVSYFDAEHILISALSVQMLKDILDV